nr:uncharacterized protein LOC117221420 [Megalopta genalis]
MQQRAFRKMAGFLKCAAHFLFLLLLNSILVSCGPGNKPVQNVPEPLIRSALNSLNEDSPTHHTYKGGNLISAQKLDESPYIIYRLTFDLTPVCKESLEPCPREACTIEVKQHEQGGINVLRESIQCMYLYPQLPQDEPSYAQVQEIQEHEIIESLDKQITTNQSVELDHEIQKTGDHNEKPFIAMRASTPNYCPGCPYELNPNLPGLAAFGEQAAKSMDEFVQNDYKHKVIDIIKVTRAVPPSSNVIQYQILLRIGESDCLKNAIEQSECSVQVSLPVKTCLIMFEEQPWQHISRRITKNNCTMSNSIDIESNINPYSTLGVESLVTPSPKKQEIDLEKSEALENLKNILDNYTNAATVKVEEHEQQEVTEHPMVKISLNRSDDNMKPQGFEDKAKDFNEFLKDFDLPTREAKSSPETNREEVREEVIVSKKVSANPTVNESETFQRNRRTVLGAPEKTNVNDPEIQEAANKGLKKLSEGYQGANEPIITEIVEASKQVVSGMLYKIKAKVGPSTCLKGVKDNCQLQEGSEIQECLFSIWSQPWIDKGSPEIKINCNSHNQKKRSVHDGGEFLISNERIKRKSGIPGAPQNADVNDPEIQEAANKGLKKLSEGYQGTNEPIIAEIVEASKQVVSGMLYKIKAKVGPSTCLKGVKDNCQLQEGSEIQECLFSVWSQPWIDKGSPEIKINCNSHNQKKRSVHDGGEFLISNERIKRKSGIPGAPQNADVNDPEIQEAANKGLKKLSEGYQGTNEPIIAEIVEASKQVVSGMLYKIKAKVGPSTCLKGVKDNCQLQEGSEIQECLFSVWSQPWIDKGSPEIKINCNSHNQKKRSVHDGGEFLISNERIKRKSGIPGAPQNADVNDPEIQEAANKGLKKLSEGYQGTNEPIIAEIVEASKQVVSGMLYKIKAKVGPSTCLKGVKDNCQLQEGSEIQECLFSVWSQPWIDKGSPEIKINCNSHNQKKRSVHDGGEFLISNERIKRKSGIPGAPQNADVNDPEIQEAANKGLKKLSEGYQGTNEPIIAEIVEASKQVVSGMLYKIKAKVGPSTCLKGVKDNCQLQEGSEIQECLFSVWSQPWIDKGSPEIKINCNSHNQKKRSVHDGGEFLISNERIKRKSGIPGAPQNADVNDPEIQEAANKGLKKLSEGYQGTNEPIIAEIVEASKQVVSGMLYKIKAKVGPSTCLKGVKDNCQLQEGSEIQECLFSVWSQPWIDKGSPEIKINCNSHNQKKRSVHDGGEFLISNERIKRKSGIPGAPQNADVNDPEIQEAANKGLKKLSEGYQGTNEPIIAEIVEASKQVVSGMLYKIKAKVGPSTCLKGVKDNCQLQEGSEIQECLFSVWSQPWIDKGSPEIKINCNSHNQKKRSVHDGGEFLISNERIKRKSGIPGAPQNADVNDPEIQEAANKGLKKLSEGYQGTNEPIIAEIVEASKQVVSGMLYKIKAKVGPSTCLKGVKDNCQLQEGSEIQECLFSVWSQPWIDKGSPEIKINCNSHNQKKRSVHDGGEFLISNERIKRKSGIPGAPQNADVNDPEIQEAANKGLKKLSEGYQGTNEPIIAEIVEASKQVVSGMLYKIKAKVGPSTCLKGVKDNCQLQEGSEIQECLFSVWSQPWIDKGSPEIKINCNSHNQKKRSVHDGGEFLISNERIKRKSGIPGAPQNADVNDPEIQEAANKGLKKLSEGYQGTNEPIIAEIVEASKQVVSGMLYKIKAKVGPSTCLKGVKDNCQLQEGSEIQECLFSVWSQPWIDKGSPEIKINCNSHNQKKRSVHDGGEFLISNERIKRKSGIPGAPQNADVNDPEIQEAANKGLKKLSEGYQGTNEPIIAEIVEASKQVVSGMLYKIKAKVGPSTCLKGVKDNCQLQEGSEIQECLFSVWSQPWIDKGSPEIKINCNSHNQKKRSVHDGGEFLISNERIKRKSGIPGAPQNADVNDPEIQEAANKGLKKLSEGYQGTNEPIIAEIVEASKQVVSGMLYKIKAKVGPSTCLKGVKDNCQLQEGSEIQECLFSVWSQPWIDKGSPEIKINCNSHNQKKRSVHDGGEFLISNERIKRKSGIPGAPQNADVNDPEIQEAANKGLKKLSEGYQGTNEPIIAEIVEASKQVVSGMLYKIKAKVGPSTCLKGVKDNCQLQEGSEIQECLFSVWSQPWIDKGSPEVKINCNSHNQKKRSVHDGGEFLISNERIKRKSGIPGAPQNADVNDPEIQEAANKGLKKLSEGYQGTNEPIIAEIVEASKQVVSGMLYKIKAKVGPSTCLKGVKDNCQLQEGSEIQECLFSVWSQPWIDKGSPEIKINCNSHNQKKRSVHDGGEFLISNERIKRKSGIPGAPQNADVNDPEIQEAANKGLKKLSEGYQGTNEPIIAEIVEASKQTVSGTLYKIRAKVGSSTCLKGVKDNCQLQEGSEIQECLFSVWSQPWVDKGSAEITINCNLHNQKKRSIHDAGEFLISNERIERESGMRGAPQNTDVNDPEIQEAANKGLKKLSEGYQGTNEPIIAEIVEASKQVVSGMLYKIKAKVGPSTCLKGVKDNCRLQEGSEIQECLFSVWSQPWIDKGSPEIKINCNSHNQKKRSVHDGGEFLISNERIKRKSGIPGAPQDANVNDPEIQEAANKGLKKLSEGYQGANEPIIAEIVEASKQVVSGMLYKIRAKVGPSTCLKGVKDNCQLQEGSEIQECLFSVWSQPWIDKGSPEIKINCNSHNQKKRSVHDGGEFLISNERIKRKSGIPGAPQDANVNDPEIQEAANKGLKKLSEGYQGANEPIIAEIVEASKQVVSGMLYKIRAKVGPSTCLKGVKDNCRLQEGSEIQECLFSVWSQPWVDEGSPEITIDCNVRNQREKGRTKRKSGVVGVANSVNVNDPEIKNLANKGLQKFAENSEGTNEPMIVDIVEASQQVVSGLLYKIKVKLGTSTCPRGVKGECQLNEGSDIKECLFTIWSQPWKDMGSPHININCDLSNRRKRMLRGVDYNKKMLKIAEEAAEDIKEQYMFEKFLREHNKTYSSVEEKQSRFEIFKRNLKLIEELRDAEQGTAKYGITMFADLTPKEFKANYLGYRPNLKHENAIPFLEAKIPDIDLPPKFDWRDRRVVTPVKNQGACGSCWAFSVTGNVESQYAINHGKLLSLSEQELVDCDKYDSGCGGGEMENAYRTIEQLGGLELETDYPYDARNEKCHFNDSKAVVKVVDARTISSNETDMAKWLVKNGPISIAINANAMQFYVGGVSHPFRFMCNPKNLDHGVLIVGYGKSVYPIFHNKELPYWIIKNSWGPRWGEQGYYRVYRGDGTCGLNLQASTALVA